MAGHYLLTQFAQELMVIKFAITTAITPTTRIALAVATATGTATEPQATFVFAINMA